MHILKGRMGIEVIELGPVPLGGNLEEKDFLGWTSALGSE